MERGFLTAQDRLVKGMRVAEVTTLEQANHYLETELLPWVFGLQSGERWLDIFGRFLALPQFPSFGAFQLAMWLQDDFGLQDYVPDCCYHGIIENSLGNAGHPLAARDAAVIEPAKTGTSDDDSAAEDE